MQELLYEALRPVNLPFTVLLGAIVMYWLLVSVGALGLDLGADADAEMDSDGGSHGPFAAVVSFINAGDVPLTAVLSIFVLALWTLSMMANFYWVGDSLLRWLVAVAVIFVVSGIITRVITAPLKPLMRALNKPSEEHIPVVGRTCQITTSEANPMFGQAQIETGGAPLLINVRTMDGTALPRGSTGLVVKADPDKELYYVVEVSSDLLT